MKSMSEAAVVEKIVRSGKGGGRRRTPGVMGSGGTDGRRRRAEDSGKMDLAQETGCSRTKINREVKDGNIPGGALRENNKPRGNVILQQTGLDYLKRKGGKDKKDR